MCIRDRSTVRQLTVTVNVSTPKERMRERRSGSSSPFVLRQMCMEGKAARTKAIVSNRCV